MPIDHYCWYCHKECSVNLLCNKCNRNFHLTCASEFGPHLIRGPDGLLKFVKVCPECNRTADAVRRWTKGQDFEPISRKILNNLLLYILDTIKQDAPEPFLWPSTQFPGCANKIDVNKITQRAKDNFYESPKNFLNDIYTINHNCLIIWRYANKFRIDRSISNKMIAYDIVVNSFKSNIERKVRYLEDCPHCIWNFTRSAENWLTMACPWGHPLIITDVDKKVRPAKMIKFNRKSERVDVILFGYAERTRVAADKCWIPSAADLAIDRKDCKEVVLAKNQANKYLETLEKRFKLKITFGKERKKLTDSDKDYIKLSASQENEDDIIELTDDESSIVLQKNKIRDVDMHKTAKDDSTEEANKGFVEINDEINGDDKYNLNIDEDEIIDEVCALDDSSSESNSPSPLLTTLIERVTPSPEPKGAPSDTNVASKPTLMHIQISSPVLAPEPEPSPNSTPIAIPTPSPPLTPIITPISTSTTPPPMTPPSFNDEQFSIVSDNEFDTLNNETDPELVDTDESMSISPIKSLLLSGFVVEEDRDSKEDTLNVQFQPISSFCFTCIQEDTVFESTIRVDCVSLHPSDSDYQINSSEIHQSKKIKLDPDTKDISYLNEIKRLEQQLEFAEKEKQLNLQHFIEIQEQLRLTKQMEETKLKTVELQFLNQINNLKETIEQERQTNKELNQKLVENIAQGLAVIRKLKDTNLSEQNRLREELRVKDERHKQEIDIAMEEIASLKRKLYESEKANQNLQSKYNIILPKYNKLQSKLLSLSQEFGNDDKVNCCQNEKVNN